MQRITLGIILCLSLVSFAAVPVRADDYKIGFIDSEKIFAAYKGTSQAQTEFNNDIQKWTKELETKKQELQNMVDEYQNQSLILSEAKRREKEEEIQSKRSELDSFNQEIWGPNGRVAQRNEQLTKPIVEKIREVLSDIGQTEGFSIVFDATDGNVVYADHALDLTDRVIERLNQEQ